MISFLNRTISWSFYALFFLVPLAFNDKTSELFEFNKLWLTFGLATIIIASWLVKSILEKRLVIKRTPLDIPILLFLGSQLVSTVISLDSHTSFWGYYSRFNGGFLSLLTYILLYYAFVSNVKKGELIRYFFSLILSGILVSLWGIPSHFGYDPTCFIFRGTFDVSCWTNAFQPKVRIFSTLGQPDWLSAYLATLIPLSIGLGAYYLKQVKIKLSLFYLLSSILFYIAFLYSHSRGGFIGLIISLVAFLGWYVWSEKKQMAKLLSKPKKFIFEFWYLLVIIISFAVFTFAIGTSFDQVDKFMLPSILQKMQAQSHPNAPAPAPKPQVKSSVVSTGEFGGTDSGKIRLYVWRGAIQAWLHYPIFGTGVETFAYAYYLFMPPAHNLTSEFGYLYNKAHNEYLNYLATTGIVGFGAYMLMVAYGIWLMAKGLGNIKKDPENPTLYALRYVPAGILASYIGILIINFFGFSVVIVNIFLFIFPAFVFLLQDQLNPEKTLSFPKIVNRQSSIVNSVSPVQWISTGVISVIAVYFLYILILYWNADRAYGLGQNLVGAGDYQSAYQPLHQAVQMRPGEPTFQDEMSLDDAVLAVALAQDKSNASNATAATQLAQEAIAVSNNLTTTHPNIVTYWKTRVRIMYSLAQLNPQYMAEALTAIEKASQLAPTDAKVSYNLGLIQGQTGDVKDAIVTLQHTLQLKKDYEDAYYALGLFYHAAGVDKAGKITDPIYAQKAIDTMHFILDNFGPYQQASDALKAWGTE